MCIMSVRGRRFLNLPSLRPAGIPQDPCSAEPAVARPTEAVGVREIFKESSDLVRLHFKQIPLVASEWSTCGQRGAWLQGPGVPEGILVTWSERSVMPCLGGQEGGSHPGSLLLSPRRWRWPTGKGGFLAEHSHALWIAPPPSEC